MVKTDKGTLIRYGYMPDGISVWQVFECGCELVRYKPTKKCHDHAWHTCNMLSPTICGCTEPVTLFKKKKTFYRASANGSLLYTGKQNPVDVSSLWAAREYMEANPGSILEIVVRKPVK